MGNAQNQPTLEIQIELDKERFSVDELITGKLTVIGADPNDYDVEIKIQGFEEGEFKEPQSCHKYKVKKNNFYTQILNQNNLRVPQFVFDKISQPSLEINSQQLTCKIYYKIQANVFVNNSKTKQTSEIFVDIYKPYKSVPYQKDRAYQRKKEFFIKGKNRVFIYDMKRINIQAALDKLTYNYNEPILLDCVSNALNNITIKAYLCAEFYLQDRFVAAMPKLQLSDPQQYQINKQQQRLEFKIYQNVPIPPITLGEKIGCRHLVILQILFPQNKNQNCDILLPLEIFINGENNEQQSQIIQSEQNMSMPSSPGMNESQQLVNHPSSISQKNKEWRNVYPMFELEIVKEKNMRIAQTDQFIQIPH